MKKAILPILLIVLLSISIKGQTSYLSIFGDTTTKWSIIPFGACDAVVSEEFSITKDTIINSITYQVLDDYNPSTINIGSGFLREDTLLGKVWFYDTSFNMEYLVMDLNLNLGDPFNIVLHSQIYTTIFVDSVYYESGKKHIRFSDFIGFCGSTGEKIEFVEGSGPNLGFHFHNQYGLHDHSYMLCHFKDQVMVQGNTLYQNTCTVYDVGIDELNKQELEFRTFPNPFSEQVSLEFNTHSNYEIKLFNLLGKELLSFNMIGLDHTFSTSHLPSGVYIIQVRSKNRTSTKKLIKK